MTLERDVRALRMSFRAYSMCHEVEISCRGRSVRGRLIDISSYGARVKADASTCAGLMMGMTLDLNILLTHEGLESGPFPCLVSWVAEDEVEMAFRAPLWVSTGRLQRAVDY